MQHICCVHSGSHEGLAIACGITSNVGLGGRSSADGRQRGLAKAVGHTFMGPAGALVAAASARWSTVLAEGSAFSTMPLLLSAEASLTFLGKYLARMASMCASAYEAHSSLPSSQISFTPLLVTSSLSSAITRSCRPN